MSLCVRAERDVEREPISLEDASCGGDQEHVSKIRHRLVAIQRALRHVGRAPIEVCQDGPAPAPLEAKTQEAGLADRAAPHLRRLVLKRREFRQRRAERFRTGPGSGGRRHQAGVRSCCLRSNRNSFSISATSSGMPSPVLQLVNRNGLLPRISRESCSITSRLAPT